MKWVPRRQLLAEITNSRETIKTLKSDLGAIKQELITEKLEKEAFEENYTTLKKNNASPSLGGKSENLK